MSTQRKPVAQKQCDCNTNCLKNSCGCFAADALCTKACSCTECFNLLGHEDKIDASKVDKVRVGCNCMRSTCMKNYCPCYKAKLICQSQCGCVGCKNVNRKKGESSGWQWRDDSKQLQCKT